MTVKWIAPNTIIGPVATGDYYYPRTEITDEIWEELKKGNYILIAAPRRVGKTSIMRDLEKNSQEGYILKFENIQAVKSEKDFYETIYRLILSCLSLSKKSRKWFVKYLKSKAISEVNFSTLSIKIEDKTFNYLNEISAIFKELDSSAETIVLLLDELPEVLHKINKAGNPEEAKAIINQLRTWRQSGFKKLQFVLAGSIGIHHVVKIIEGRTANLNDLNNVKCKPLTRTEASAYVDWATQYATIKYEGELKSYLLDKIHYYTPFFINLMLDEINKKGRKDNSPTITNQDIDNAFNRVIINNDHFADWKNRLKDYMPPEDFHFVNEVLIHIGHKNSIDIQTIYDKAVKNSKQTDYMYLIDDLNKDGYIIEEIEGNKKYIFISPFLKEFWFRNNPIYNEK